MNIFLLLAVIITGNVESRNMSGTPGVRTVKTLISPTLKLKELDALGGVLGLVKPFSLRIVFSTPVAGGLTKHRLALLYEGLPVRSFTFHATTDGDGVFSGTASGYVPDLQNLDTSIIRNYDELKRATADFVNRGNIREDIGNIGPNDISHFRVIKAIQVDKLTGNAKVIYFCEGVIDAIPSYNRWPRVLLDAETLAVIAGSFKVRNAEGFEKIAKSCPSIQGGNQKFRHPFYGPSKGEVCLNAAVKGNRCSLNNSNVIVKSLDSQYDISQAEVVTFRCVDGLNDGINGASSPAADAFHYVQKFYDLLEDWGGVETTRSDPIQVYVHYGQNVDSAFYDGASIYLGDGSDLLFPLASHEVIGHEVTEENLCHALSADWGTLVFESESLAIDESFADICGRALGSYLSIVADDNWEFGANIVKQSNLALRYFDDPTRDNWSIKSVNDFDRTTNPFQAVGIFNHVYYLLVQQYNFSHRDAFRTFLLANRLYWQEETDFQDGACGVKRAAGDLGLDGAAFDSAFSAVDISLNDCSGR